MIPIIGGTPRCKRCGNDVERGRVSCPACNYNPKSKGLRVALSLLLAVVVLMTAVLLSPVYRLVLIRLAALAFLCSLLAILLSFLATPHRLGRLFLWP